MLEYQPDISPLNKSEIMMRWEYFLLVTWIKNQRIYRYLILQTAYKYTQIRESGVI